MAKTEKAKVATVNLGGVRVEGLLLPNGEFGVGVSQLAEAFGLRKSDATKEVQRLLGKGSNLGKWTSELAKRPVSVMSLPQLETLLLELAIKGNLVAIETMRALSGLALVQLFSDAFHIKFVEEDRKLYIEAREKGKVIRKTMTSTIAAWNYRTGIHKDVAWMYYAGCSDAVNVGLFGHQAADLIQWFGCKKNNLRDQLTPGQLHAIEQVEYLAGLYIEDGAMEPVAAAKAAVAAHVRVHGAMLIEID